MTNNIPQNAVELANKYGEKIDSALQQLSAKLGLGIDHFWPVLVEQQRMEGMVSIILFLFTILFIGGVFILAGKAKEGIYKNNDLTWHGVFVCLGSVILCIMVIAVFLSARNVVTQITNPEYHALVEIARMIK